MTRQVPAGGRRPARGGIGVRAPRLVVIAVTAVIAFVAGCSTGDRSPVAPTGGAEASRFSATASDSTVTWGYEQEFGSYNANTATTNSVANQVVLNAVLGSFWQFGAQGQIVPATDFGSYRKVKDSPLTVAYQINPKAVWSDGTPISCDDLVLTWLANSGASGPKGFSTASTQGYQDVLPPRCDGRSRSLTVVYRRPYGDWAALFSPGSVLPAHVVAAAGGLKRPFSAYVTTPTSPELAKAIAFYNHGWQLPPGTVRPDIMPSSGPYRLGTWKAGESLTLLPNPRWWGAPPKAQRVVVRFLAGTAQPQALENGEIQMMDPQPQADTLRQVRRLGDQVVVEPHTTFNFEHLDFNLAGPFKDRTLREAFARCVPRQMIVDNLVTPEDPAAVPLDSRFAFPFQADYAAMTAGNGAEAYRQVDLAGSRALLAGRRPVVRVGWVKNPAQMNRRRYDTLDLIRSSCSRVGFVLQDVGERDFFSDRLPRGDYDVALFGWSGSALVAAASELYRSDGASNFGHYADPAADTLVDGILHEVDPTAQRALLRRLDALLWKDLATVPLFAHPGLLARRRDVAGVVFNPSQADLTWNVGAWERN